MADVLTHIDTLDVEVAPQEEWDVTVGSPMEHSRILSITKNGKHVVSEYDLADVDVEPSWIDKYIAGGGKFGYSTFSILPQNITTLPEDCSSLFRYASIVELNAAYWNTKKTTNLMSMFSGCGKLKELHVTHWDTSNVVRMNSLFNECALFQEVDLSQWNCEKVINTAAMFRRCMKLKTIIGKHTLEEVENGDIVAMKGMRISINFENNDLRYSSILATIKGFDAETSKVLTLMNTTFNKCYNDDDTIPSEDVISERQATIRAICAKKVCTIKFV